MGIEDLELQNIPMFNYKLLNPSELTYKKQLITDGLNKIEML